MNDTHSHTHAPTPPRRGAGALTAAVLAVALASAAVICTAAPADASVAFIDAWRLAAAKPGGEAIADLTAWPFLFQGRQLQREAFVAQAVPALFTPAVRRCLQRAKPLPEDGRQVMSCAPYGFVFAPTSAGWRLVEFFADTP